ncbi:hypothetical protein L208DRAFT_1405056 [Tricholoma matsutake]|nr:hypothetical protein L208DRAFT_1405056 [Tricholoma matsutake 945]
MRSFFAGAILAFVLSIGVTIAVPEDATSAAANPDCYFLPNFGSTVHQCEQCKENYYAVPVDTCDIGFSCCKVYCCLI